jgi:RHS repeat-associated protein
MMKNKSGTIYAAFIVSQTDYLAYGQTMPDRSFNTTAIRYTFNGKEDEIFAEWQDYGFRNYDKRQRRFTSVDPLTAKYPELTPFQFASNRPTWMGWNLKL